MVAFSPFDDRFDISPTAGFLPNETPLTRLGPTWDLWEIALDSASEGAVALHGKGQEGKIWREAVAKMPILSPPSARDLPAVRRAYTVLSFLGHFYANSSPVFLNSPSKVTKPSKTIPASIALPWEKCASILGLPPILTYSSTVLWNWDLKDRSAGFTLDNLYVPTMFTQTRTEEHFYLTSTLIEVAGAKALQIISNSLSLLPTLTDSDPLLESLIENVAELTRNIKELTRILAAVRNHCDPQTFFHIVRTWFNGPNGASSGTGWYYAGLDVQGTTRSYGGPSAGQSTLVHAIDAFLCVNHAPMTSDDGYDDTFMKRMLHYMPTNHRNLILELLKVEKPLRVFVDTSNNHRLRETYNGAIKALTSFRDEHMKIATSYVVVPARRSRSDPSEYILSNAGDEGVKGTGGTALVRFLKVCRERTKEALV